MLTTEPIYEAFYDEYEKLNAFPSLAQLHGQSACVHGRAGDPRDLQEDDVIERNRALAAHLGARARELEAHPHVAEVRQTGMIVAIEMVKNKASRAPYDWRERRGLKVYRKALERGIAAAARR